MELCYKRTTPCQTLLNQQQLIRCLRPFDQTANGEAHHIWLRLSSPNKSVAPKTVIANCTGVVDLIRLQISDCQPVLAGTLPLLGSPPPYQVYQLGRL